jgi:hypothetical protein
MTRGPTDGLDTGAEGVMRGDRVGDMPYIATAEQYREAVEEVLRLEAAREGSPEFERRQALRAALADYERRRTPERPPGVG